MKIFYKAFVLVSGMVLAGLLGACVPEQTDKPFVDRMKTEAACNTAGGLWGKFDTPEFVCQNPEIYGEGFRKTAQEKRQCRANHGIWVQLNRGLDPACMTKPELDQHAQQERQAEIECTAAGDRWGRGGLLGTAMCFPNHSDAGKSCSRASDCQGMCMSETRTCSASFSFGCLSYLNDEGKLEEICID